MASLLAYRSRLWASSLRLVSNRWPRISGVACLPPPSWWAAPISEVADQHVEMIPNLIEHTA